MLKGVVVVESPAKAKTLSTFLGKDYKILASYGHIRDLPSKAGSVDPNDHFKMIWELNDRGKKQLREIETALKGSNNLFLATDPDREGEAISWHIMESLRAKRLTKNLTVNRVVFHEITKSAILKAFEEKKQIDQDLVDAYMARRILDYLVGFSLSPILWRKMPGAKSAGRVQSVALRLIVERELEIQAFKSEEYWSIHALFQAEKGNFKANLTHYNGKKLEKLAIKNEEEAGKILEKLLSDQYSISKIEKKSVKRNPYAPFTTSTLQQEAVRKLGFSAKKTMQVAQKLYEGISINGTLSGLITYMRTDSTNLSDEAIAGSRAFIQNIFGDKYLPKSPRIYKTKSKNAQEAHEAIRPTIFDKTPDSLRNSLSDDEFRLYELIWKRTVASQMEAAIFDQVSVDIDSKDGGTKFRASGSTLTFDGFLSLYTESDDNDDTEKKSDKDKKLPILKDGEDLEVKEMTKDQHFTQPPPRFNEASLVKKLEELGIGRPSTYASIINVLQERGYVTLMKKVFTPKSIGYLTTSFLRNFFNTYIQYDFTAKMEEELDEISNGKENWENTLNTFWKDFNANIGDASNLTITEVIDRVEEDLHDFVFQNVAEDRKCPLCKEGEVHLKLGKFGAFLGCSKYPECKYTAQIGSTESSSEESGTPFPKNEPKMLGEDPRLKDNIMLKKGPYGYYFEWEKTKNEKKPKRLSVPKYFEDPEGLTLDDAIKLDSLPIKLAVDPNTGEDITLVVGRFGPFLKVGKESFKLEKDSSFLKIGEKEALKIVSQNGSE